MTLLFLIYLLCLALIFFEQRKVAYTLLAINLALSLWLFWYHHTPLNLHL
jgi:hypothetical protein